MMEERIIINKYKRWGKRKGKKIKEENKKIWNK